MNLQALVDGMSAQWQKERSETQMTLGKVISVLEKMDNNQKINGLGSLSSYRGYYSDLSFDPNEPINTAGELLEECKKAMGKVFVGYKGGDFVMGELTPMWVAEYGSTGDKLIAINEDGSIETKADED